MAQKQIKNYTEETAPIAGDYFLMQKGSDDSYAKVDQRNILPSSKTGWVDAQETWTYASFSGNVGTITVPTGAASRYSVGMKIRISQSTGGTKYGIITKIDSTTVIRVYFGTDYTLNNEAISLPYYSVQKAPFGFPVDPSKWTITKSSANDRSVAGTSYASTGDTLDLPIGSWEVYGKIPFHLNTTTTNARRVFATLSTDGSTETNPEFTTVLGQTANSATSTSTDVVATVRSILTITSAKTITLMTLLNSTSGANASIYGSTITPILIKATCAYL